MKNKLYILAIFMFPILWYTQAQTPFHLQQVHHVKIKNTTSDVNPKTFINDKGWVFVSIFLGDSIKTQSLTIDSSQNGRRIFAFDDKMRLRWSFVYEQGVNTGMGGMNILSMGKDNSVYVRFGAQDSLVLPGLEPMLSPFDGGIYIGKIDSMGYFTKVIKAANRPLTSQFNTFMVSDYQMMSVSSDMHPYLINSELETVAVGKEGISSGRSAVIQKDGTAYYCHVLNFNVTVNIVDTSITGYRKWVLSKVNKDGQREWTHVIDNNVDFEINANKMIRYDRHGNIFWTVRHMQTLHIQGQTVPYYSQGDTVGVVKASILRFSPDGKLLSIHSDTSSKVPFMGNRQTIWLENDKDMNVYAYLFTQGRTYNFDKINYGEEFQHRHRIIVYDSAQKAFTKGWHVIGNEGNIATSMLAHKQVFWYKFFSSSRTFHDGTRIEKYWNDDRLVAVYDTLAPKYPVGLQAIEEEPHALVRIYPNPSKEHFVVQNLWSGPLHCKLYSIDGKQIGEFKLEEKQSLNIENLALPGVYVLKSITPQGQSYSSKLIKQ